MPECVIMDAMLLLNTKPLRSMKTFSDYANFLFDRYVMPYYKMGVAEIHLIFDSPVLIQSNLNKRKAAMAKLNSMSALTLHLRWNCLRVTVIVKHVKSTS